MTHLLIKNLAHAIIGEYTPENIPALYKELTTQHHINNPHTIKLIRILKDVLTCGANTNVGDKVIYSNPGNGYQSDQEKCKKHLQLGEIYTVSQMTVGGTHTVLHLEEVPECSCGFNSVNFQLA